MRHVSARIRHLDCNGISMTNVVLADHESVFRTGMASVLSAEDDLRVVSQPLTPAQIIRAVRTFRPNVLVLSAAFMGLVDRILRVCEQHQTAVLLLQDYDAVEPFEFSNDFHGVIGRNADEQTLVKCVRHLARGGRVVRLTPTCQPNTSDPFAIRVQRSLTPKELKIISYVVQGYKNREIAIRMGTLENSVKNALRRIFDKTGVYGRLELALFVIHHGTLLTEAAVAHVPTGPISVPFLPSDWNHGRRPSIN